MIYNWSKYRRKQNNLEKAEYNYLVNEAISKHYRYLHSRLVKSDADESTFNDAYLKITRKYNPEQDFIDQFIHFFNQLKGEFLRDDKCYNYAESKVEAYSDVVQLNEAQEEIIKDEVKTTKQSNLINDIKRYAILEKAQQNKKKSAIKQQKRKIADISK